MNEDSRKIDRLEQQIARLEQSIQSLDNRISRLESAAPERTGSLATPTAQMEIAGSAEEKLPKMTTLNLEQRIGEYWFGQLGIVILIIGLIFFITYTFAEFPPLWQAIVGYGITAGIYGISRVKTDRFKLLANLLLPGSLFLLYFVTLRMHFFREFPIIGNKTLALSLLIVVLGVQCFVAVRHRSQFLAAIPVLLGYTTALLSDTHHFALITILATSVVAALFLSIYHWQVLGIGSIFLSYLGFLLYLLNNPLLGKQIQILPEHDWILVYLLAALVVFALVSFRPRVNEYLNTTARILLTTVNSSGFYLVGFLVTFQFFRSQLDLWNFIFFGILFTIAIANWTIRKSKYSTSFYASFGYIALTVGILTATEVPDLYLWLAWQSALVIGTAIWFRSGIIVWANLGIYTLVFAIYLLTGNYSWLVNFNFVLVALLSERVLAFSRNRFLTFPGIFRHIYLVTGYPLLVFGLSLVLPTPYVSIGWLAASVVYFGGGYVLDIPSYRIMGIGGFLLTVARIFLIDLASLELIYRVFSFLLVGLGLLVVGFLYARRR
ncbi:MAG TPA: DUF2339 domain-containing protein [bacterium]|nr:DUF2339 domain-containing protein [bacterium]